MNDDEFNTLKFKLPFLIKSDKDQFYFCVDYLKRRISSMTVVQLIDLFYTFYSLNISNIWLPYLKNILSLLPLSYKIDIIKFSCSCRDDHVDTLKSLIDDVFDEISARTDKNSLAIDFAFINSKFFKPILSSRLQSIKNANPSLAYYLIEKCLTVITNTDAKLKCLEKLKQFRVFNESEIEYIFTLINKSEYTGRVLDLCLRSNSFKLLEKAYEILSAKKSDSLYTDENAVHFFEIEPSVLTSIGRVPTKDLVTHVEELLNIARLTLDELDNIYYIANVILSSGYDIDGISIEKVFTYLWNLCDFEERKQIVEELSTYDSSVCCYGIIINMLMYVGALKNSVFLKISDKNKSQMEALEKMKSIYPENHEIWSDAIEVDKTLKNFR